MILSRTVLKLRSRLFEPHLSALKVHGLELGLEKEMQYHNMNYNIYDNNRTYHYNDNDNNNDIENDIDN